jgi:hypothetical protein
MRDVSCRLLDIYILRAYEEFNKKRINIKIHTQRHSLLNFSESIHRAEN